MHVVHLTWEYPPLVYGGLGRHVHALTLAQAAQGRQVTVVTQQQPGSPAEEIHDGVRVIRVPAGSPFPRHLPDMLTWIGGLDHALGLAARDLDADLVHAHDWVVGRAAVAAARAQQAPLVATIHATEAGRHSGWLPDPVSRSVHLVEQWLIDEADELIVCSAGMGREIAAAHDAHPDHISVIPNGIDPHAYPRPERIAEHLLTGSPRISFVGRIEWEKGAFTAVAAMPSVLQQHPGARLRMVGTGTQDAAVAQQVQELSLTGAVQMLGHVDEATLRQIYAGSDLLVAPSSYEPFGMVALEAAAMNVPLVVGDTGGLAQFVTDDRGLRHRPQDPDDLARAILSALADPAATADRAGAARAALADYTWPVIAQRTDEVYAKATRRPHPPRALRTADNPVLTQAL